MSACFCSSVWAFNRRRSSVCGNLIRGALWISWIEFFRWCQLSANQILIRRCRPIRGRIPWPTQNFTLAVEIVDSTSSSSQGSMASCSHDSLEGSSHSSDPEKGSSEIHPCWLRLILSFGKGFSKDWIWQRSRQTFGYWLLHKLWEAVASSKKSGEILVWSANQMIANGSWTYGSFNTHLNLIRFCRCRFPFSLFVFWGFIFVSFY